MDDPEGYHTELTSDLRTTEGQLDVWLLQGSERFVSDPEVSDVLIKAAREKDTRRSLLLLGAILDTPGLAERLLEALRPELIARSRVAQHAQRESRHKNGDGEAERQGAAVPAQKGGEFDESLHDLGGFLLDLFRGRLLLQFLFVCIRRRADGPIASAAFSRTRCRRAYPDDNDARGACTSRGARSGWG